MQRAWRLLALITALAAGACQVGPDPAIARGRAGVQIGTFSSPGAEVSGGYHVTPALELGGAYRARTSLGLAIGSALSPEDRDVGFDELLAHARVYPMPKALVRPWVELVAGYTFAEAPLEDGRVWGAEIGLSTFATEPVAIEFGLAYANADVGDRDGDVDDLTFLLGSSVHF